MKQRRDDFQRKCAAIRRMTIAMTRLDRAASIDDKVKAGRWVAAWQVVADIRQFKLDRSGKGVFRDLGIGTRNLVFSVPTA